MRKSKSRLSKNEDRPIPSQEKEREKIVLTSQKDYEMEFIGNNSVKYSQRNGGNINKQDKSSLGKQQQKKYLKGHKSKCYVLFLCRSKSDLGGG